MRKWLPGMMCGIGGAMAAEISKVDAALAEYDAHVAELRAACAKQPEPADEKSRIKARLRHLVTVDQYVRNFSQEAYARKFPPPEFIAFNKEITGRMAAIDAANTAELKELVGKYGWLTISEFGADTDHDAWLLVQHADADPEFQREIIKRLEPLVARGETSPKTFAYLFDRVALSFQDPSKRTLQRFGTQGQCTGPGTWEPFPVEEPDKLDERRGTVGLPPMAEYKKMFRDVCHESTDETVRKATEAARKGATP